MHGPDPVAPVRAAMRSLIPHVRMFAARHPLRGSMIAALLVGILVCAGLTRVVFAILDDLLPSVVMVAMLLLSVTPFCSRVMRHP